MVVLAMIYTRTFYLVTALFRRLPIVPHAKPMIGAFLTAVAGVGLYLLFGRQLEVLSVLSFGYGILQQALELSPRSEGSMSVALLLLAVAFGKIITTSLTIGSGGSGGVFGPSMVIGGCGGGALGILLHTVSARLVPHPASFVIVGMAGFFAAAAKTPFSTLVMVSELTGNYNLILPTLWVCALSFLLADEQSIYSSQVTSRSRSPAHQGDYVREVLAGVSVSQFLTEPQTVPTVRPGDPLDAVLEQLGNTPYHILPVTEGDGKLVGIVGLEEVHLATQLPHARPLLKAADLMRSDVTPLRARNRLDLAVELFAEFDVLALPVVDESPEAKVIGVVRRSDVFSTYVRLVHGAKRTPSSEGIVI
jgi:chloride channel protein, CIC family